ncbi:MAG: MBL fold metallo-hydrolase [Candidatus Odinarchaeia archaeon]
MVKITWLGHACFAVEGENVVVVTDPHDGKGIGLKPPSIKGDIILVSHGHYDHADGVPLVKKEDSVVLQEFVGEKEVKGVKIKGIRSYHDLSQGKERGINVIYVFEVDGLKFAHLGDLGHVLGSDAVEEIGQIDVLFIPVGGTYTIDHSGATKLYNEIKPKIAIPMHFKTEGLTLPLTKVDTFLAGKQEAKRLGVNQLEVSKETLPENSEIIALKPTI